MKNLRRKERKPGNDIHVKLGRKKIQELGRLTLIIARKGTALKGPRRKNCIASRLLSSAEQDPNEGVFFFRGGNLRSFTKSRIGVLQKITDPFPKILLYVRTPLRKDSPLGYGTRYSTTEHSKNIPRARS